MAEPLDFSEQGDLLDFSSGGEPLPDFSSGGKPVADTVDEPTPERLSRRRRLADEMQQERARGSTAETVADVASGLAGIPNAVMHPVEATEKGIEAAATLITGKPQQLLVKPSDFIAASERPLVKIPEIPRQQSTPAKIAAGVGNAAINFANFLQSPQGVAMLFGIGKLPDALRRAVTLAIASQMGSSAPESFNAAVDAAKEGDLQKVAQHTTEFLVNTAFSAGATRHGLDKPGIVGPQPTTEGAPNAVPEPSPVRIPQTEQTQSVPPVPPGVGTAESGVAEARQAEVPQAPVEPTGPGQSVTIPVEQKGGEANEEAQKGQEVVQVLTPPVPETPSASGTPAVTLPPSESVLPKNAPEDLQQKRENLIKAADINPAEFDAVETAIARVNGGWNIDATAEAIRQASHGVPAITYLKGVAASADPTAGPVIERAKQILDALPHEEQKARRRRAPENRPWDLIDEVEAQLGGPISLPLARKLIENFSPVGAARKLFAAKGVAPDVAAESTGRVFKTFDYDVEFLDALNAAAQARKEYRAGKTGESKALKVEEKQTEAFEEARKNTARKQPVVADSLVVGDEFEIAGTKVKVAKFDFDENGEVTYVTLEDGKRFGTQRVDGQTVLHIDKDSLAPTTLKPGFLPEEEPKQETAPKPEPPKPEAPRELLGNETPFNLVGETVRPPESVTGYGDERLAQQEMFAIQRITELKDPGKSADAAQRIHGSSTAAAAALERQLRVVDSDPKTKRDFGKEQRARLKEVIALLHQRSTLDALEALKVPTDGTLHAFGLVPAIWNGAIDVAKTAVKAGFAISDAVDKAVAWIKEQHKGKWQETAARVALLNTLKGEPKRVRTQVMGGEHLILEREGLNDQTRAESISHAEKVFGESGVKAQLRQEGDPRRNMPISWWEIQDTGTQQNVEGQKLVDRLRQEIMTQNEPGKGPELLASLINSVRLNFERGNMDQIFDRPIREQLYRLAQSEASHRGAMLGALAGHSVDLSFVSKNVDVALYKVYSDAFGGDGIESLMHRVQELERADPKFDTDPEGARARAVKKARATLTEGEKEVIGTKKRRWNDIQKVLLDGTNDPGTVLRAMAKKEGWPVPTENEIARMKTLAAEEERLRALTPKEAAEAHAFGDLDRAQREKEAATQIERAALKKEMQTRWARMSRPIVLWPFRSAWQTRQNLAAALNELAAANLLTRLAFVPRQVIGVLSQAVAHGPGRAIGNALLMRHDAIQRGEPQGWKSFWDDTGEAMRVSVRAQANAIRPALMNMRAAFRGRGLYKNVDHLMSGIGALDRIELKAKELQAQGKNAQAALLWMYTQIKWGYRVAQSLDYLHGTPAEAQEVALMTERALAENVTNRAERLQAVDYVIGNAKREWAEAVATVQRILDASGIKATPQQLQERAGHMIKHWQFERARELGLPADDFEGQADILRNTIGWNERETNGLGGLVATMGKGAQRIAGEAGVPLPLASFSNAIGIAINRALHFTPFYKLANTKLPGGTPENSPWFKTEADRQQRKVEALVGTMVGTPLILMAATGALVVQLKPPTDKEERELWEREGHKSGTVEVPTGDGSFIPISLNNSPLTPVASYLAAGGAIYKLLTDRQKAQDKLNAEAAKKGIQPGQIRPINATDIMMVAANAFYGTIVGGSRTASGLVGSLTEYGLPNAQKSIASQLSPLIPGLPALQEISRMGGVVLDQKVASIWDFMLPLPSSGARKLNLLGEPAGTPDDLQRIVQTLTGGTYGPIDPNEAHSQAAYAALFASGYRPPSISPNKGYNINGVFRPMNDEELVKYTKERGERLREALAPLGATTDVDAVKKAYQEANAAALQSVGATAPVSERTSSGGTGGASGGVAGVALGNAGPSSRGGTIGLGGANLAPGRSRQLITRGRSARHRGRPSKVGRGFTRTRTTGVRRVGRGLRTSL